ncbi:hypothetical protein GYM73_06090 [Apibacter sp. ESL0432]|uniref:hypothetical protein n=1 Tax=Apibacter sp. ESL0432 TaxID=2704652 RepID=UPI001C696850|nr:hypothetical protein [Apibacter sp. ESL0432]QYN49195.1 hypothetical protein GYM73_06090 [Apibacter sp. ESL0432]
MKTKFIFLGMLLVPILSFSQIGVNTNNPQGTFHVDGMKDNAEIGAPTPFQGANDFIVTSDGNVGVGTAYPDASSILELNVEGLSSGSKKGFLGPRVSLTSNIDTLTIPNPAVGLLVYNLGDNPNFVFNGYVFWNGKQWKTLDGRPIIPGIIQNLTCNAAMAIPSFYTANERYHGVMTVPYTGGDGGTYPAQSIGPVNGLTATLEAGQFNVGNGALRYVVDGIPTVSSPQTTTFPLSVAMQNCEATIGAGLGLAPGERVYYQSPYVNAGFGDIITNPYNNVPEYWLSKYVNDLPILGGKLRLDAYLLNGANTLATVSYNPRLVNITSSPVKLWFGATASATFKSNANIILAPRGGYVSLDDGIWANLGENMVMASGGSLSINPNYNQTEILTADVSLDDKWYKIYFFGYIDNMDTSTVSDNLRRFYISIQRLY